MIKGWKKEYLSTVDEVFSRFISFRTKTNFWVFRGSNVESDSAFTSIDRIFEYEKLSRSEKISLERQSIEAFRMDYKLYPTAEVLPLLDIDIQTLMLMQHYGARTRLLDWSRNPYIALYFAVCDQTKDKCNGQVLGFEYNQYLINGSQQWCCYPEMYDEQRKFKKYLGPAFDLDYKGDWFVCQFLNDDFQFPRILAQNGLFTFTSQFGIDHAKKIQQLLNNNDCHKEFIIKNDAKREIRKTLLEKYHIYHGRLFPDSVGAANSSNELLIDSIYEINTVQKQNKNNASWLNIIRNKLKSHASE